MRRAIEQLPAEFREIILLREMENLSYKEVADIADLPIGTVMSHDWASCRERLAKILSDPLASEATHDLTNRRCELLHGYVDGELDVVRASGSSSTCNPAMSVRDNWPICACARRAGEPPDLYYTAPRSSAGTSPGSLGSPSPTPSRQFSWCALAIAASILFVATLGLTTLRSTLHDRDFLTAQ